jgi:hypothetical protein
LAGLILADPAHRQNANPKIGEIVNGVGPSAGKNFAFPVLQDKDWRLPGYARDFPKDKLVRHHVPQNGHGDVGKFADDFPQAFLLLDVDSQSCDFSAAAGAGDSQYSSSRKNA